MKLRILKWVVLLFIFGMNNSMVLSAQESDLPPPPLPKLLGNRFLTFASVIRVRQIETTRDSAEGPDETSIHSPATAQAFRDMSEKS